MASEDIFSRMGSIFAKDTQAYIENPEKLLVNVFGEFNRTQFSPLHKQPSKVGLVRARCMVQDSRGTEFVSMSCDLKKGDEVVKTTMLLRDGFIEQDGELVSCDGNVGRHCYSMVQVPGATQWFIEDFTTDEELPEKKTCAEFEGLQNIPDFVGKFIGEGSDDLKPNTILDLFGVFSHHKLEVGNESGSSTNRHNVPNLHVIKYDVVDTAACVDAKIPQEDMKAVRNALKKKLVALVGEETSAEFLMACILSSTYSRAGGMPICSTPVNLMGVHNSTAIVSFLKTILPKVKHLQLTPSLLSNASFAPVKDYSTEALHQGELQLANGTLLVIDETQLPEGSFPVSGHVEANLKVLEQLILEQRINYDYGFYKIPFDVDYPILILSKKSSRILKTPYCVPYLPPPGEIPQDSTTTAEDARATEIIRKYIQMVRNNLKNISITADTTKDIQTGFVDLCRNVDKSVDKADLLNELLILSRVVAASEGSDVVAIDHWQRAIATEAARKEVCHEFSSIQ